MEIEVEFFLDLWMDGPFTTIDGKKLLLDITIIHPWAKMNLSGSSNKAGFSACAKEKEKYLKKASIPAICRRGLWTMG